MPKWHDITETPVVAKPAEYASKPSLTDSSDGLAHNSNPALMEDRAAAAAREADLVRAMSRGLSRPEPAGEASDANLPITCLRFCRNSAHSWHLSMRNMLHVATKCYCPFVRLARELEMLFWDVQFDTLEVERDSDFILPRILEFGRLPDVGWLVETYG